MAKRLFLIFLLTSLTVLYFYSFLFAEKVVIVYTGDSHGSLYPCRCPKAPNGGIARRATKIKELRAEYTNLLVLDSGNYFAGGMQDIDRSTLELNKIRTKVNLLAMKTIGYDALGIGRDEFNFGKEFLSEIINTIDINFLSCNLDLAGVRPYIIKKLNKIKIGIIGISPLNLNIKSDVKTKNDFSETIKTIETNLRRLKDQKTDIVILLSQLGSKLDKQLVDKITGIDIIIGNGSSNSKDKYENRIGSVIYLEPYPWAKTLGVAELDIEDGKIKSFVVKKLPLGKDISDDPEIKSLLPRCFRDEECYRAGLIGRCKSAGKLDSECVYEEQLKVPLLIITPEVCKSCKIDDSLGRIRRRIPNLKVSYLNADDKQAKRLIKTLKITMLPAFLLGKEIVKYNSFNYLFRRKIIEKKGNYYLVNPSFAGVSYFLDRRRIKNRLDLFISLRDKLAKNVLDKTKQMLDNSKGKIDFHLHFLAMERKNKSGFMAPYGNSEIEEDKIALCVIKKYPEKMWDYLFCHTNKLQEGLFDSCIMSLDMDAEFIKQCSISNGDTLLKRNIELTEELGISYGPLFLLENQEIFGVEKNTTVEELERMIDK
jgi:hypothetical protein